MQYENRASPTRSIIATVAEAFDVSSRQLLGRSRTAHEVRARHVALYLARSLTGRSFPAIGRSFGMDHSSVVYAVKKIRERIENDADERAFVESLAERVSCRG